MTLRPRSTVRRFAVLALAGVTVIAPACGDDSDTAGSETDATTTTAASAEIVVADVWARTSPMQVTNGAAYMVIQGGATDDALVAASVDPSIAAEAQIHETSMADAGHADDADDMGSGNMGSDTTMAPAMEMHEVDSIAIPAGETVTFEPGGYHVMFMGLATPLEVGTTFELTLTFEVAGERTVTVEVRDSP